MKKLAQYTGATLATALLYTALFLYVDQPLAWAVYHSDFVKKIQPISQAITLLGTSKVWFCLAAVAILWGFLKRQKAYLYLGASTGLAILLGKILKYILGRYRPSELIEHGQYGFHFFSNDWLLNSSPSGHTVCIFAVATALSVLYRRYASIFFIIAILVGISRVMLGVHYLSDIIFGAYVGILSACLLQPLLDKKKQHETHS